MDDEAALLARSFVLLQQLKLTIPQITDSGWAHLASLQRLRCLKLVETGEAALVHVASCLTALQSLTLQRCAYSDAGLASVSLLTALREFHLEHRVDWVTDSGMRCLSCLTALQRLTFTTSSPHVTDATLAVLSQLPLIDLSFSHRATHCQGISDAGIEFISRLPLQHLELSLLGHSITAAGSSYISKLMDLKELVVSGSWLADEAFAGIGFLSLTRLELFGCSRLTDAAYLHVSTLPSLENLVLRGLGIGDSGLAHISHCSSLRRLQLACLGGISDSALQHVARLSNLECLDLRFCRHVSDGGLALLSQAPALQELRLIRMRSITDAGLARLPLLRLLMMDEIKRMLP